MKQIRKGLRKYGKMESGMDLMEQLGPLAFASRMRRLSEMLHRDVSRFYQDLEMNFEARWFPLLYLLGNSDDLPVTVVAEHLRMTHPAINQIAAAMANAGLLESQRDRTDERRRLLALSSEGRRLFNELLPVWKDIEAETASLLEQCALHLMDELGRIEKSLDALSMYERLHNRRRGRLRKIIDIVPYRRQYKAAFRELNYQWLQRYFTVEPADEQMLSHPEREVLKRGGEIFFALVDGRVVGTTAVVRLDSDTVELTKMAVADEFRRNQAGRSLLEAALGWAKRQGARRMVLLTSPKLEAAVALYESAGFTKLKKNDSNLHGYERYSIQFELMLE